MKTIMIHLQSNCDFWMLSEQQKADLTAEAGKLGYRTVFWNDGVGAGQLADCEIYWGWNFDPAWLPDAPLLKWIVVPSAGKDHLPEQSLREHGIVLTTSTSYHGIPMSEQIMAYLLGFSRGIFQNFGKQTTELWWKESVRESFFDIYGKTMLIVGCGSVGLRLAGIAGGFGMKVLGYSRTPDILRTEVEWVRPDALSDALGRADVVVDLLPLNESSRLFFGRERLSQIKRGSVFINVGRGGTVDEEALAELVREKHIAYCALDVFDPKPPAMSNPLRTLDNCVMTPKTSVFFRQYMDLAIAFFLTALKKYTQLLESMNTDHVEPEYVRRAVERYFSSSRMRNFGRDTYTASALFPIACRQDREELIRAYEDTGRNWPFLAFTINSVCNRRCLFCEPTNKESQLMPLPMYRALAQEANRWHVTKAHLSGGEPTLRRDVVEIAQILNEELKSENKQIGITTNGSFSYSLIDRLLEAGINTFNFSIHSLNEDHYKTIMGGGSSAEVMEKVRYVMSKGVRVKVNCTLLRSFAEDAIDIIKLAKDNAVAVRVVELQNINLARTIFDREFLSEKELWSRLCEDPFFEGLSTAQDVRDTLGVRSPGVYYRPENWAGSFGFISNTSKPVCMDGNRIKVTPTGRIRPCTMEKMDINLVEIIEKGLLKEAFQYLFLCYLTRDCNPEHRGYHYIDSDLRWDKYSF